MEYYSMSSLFIFTMVLIAFLFFGFYSLSAKAKPKENETKKEVELKNAETVCSNVCVREKQGDKMVRTCTQTCEPIKEQKWQVYT